MKHQTPPTQNQTSNTQTKHETPDKDIRAYIILGTPNAQRHSLVILHTHISLKEADEKLGEMLVGSSGGQKRGPGIYRYIPTSVHVVGMCALRFEFRGREYVRDGGTNNR